MRSYYSIFRIKSESSHYFQPCPAQKLLLILRSMTSHSRPRTYYGVRIIGSRLTRYTANALPAILLLLPLTSILTKYKAQWVYRTSHIIFYGTLRILVESWKKKALWFFNIKFNEIRTYSLFPWNMSYIASLKLTYQEFYN